MLPLAVLLVLVWPSVLGGPYEQPRFVIPTWATPESFLSGPDDGYTSTIRTSPNYKVVHNAWWQAHRFYAFLRPEDMNKQDAVEDGLSTNQAIIRMPVANMGSFRDNLQIGYVPGNSLLVDFTFQTFADHLGHWAELMVPIYSMLRDGAWQKDVQLNGTSKASTIIDRVVTTNMNRHHGPWFSAVFQTALQPATQAGQSQPYIIDYADLETYHKLSWVVFENLLVVQDRYTHPQNRKGFAGSDHGDLWRYDRCERYVSHDYVVRFSQPHHGREFRQAIYARERLPAPQPWTPGQPPQLPRTITFLLQAGDDYPGITNHEEVFKMLQEVGGAHGMKARVMTLTPEASLGTHLAVAANTGVLVGRHSSAMAASLFMPPGSAVLELLPFKWEWAKVSMLYYNITQSIGDIHHFAWRANHYKWADFKNSSDRKYHTWTSEECHARECLLVHAKASMIVDLAAVKQMLLSKLPRILTGAPVEELREPWPLDTHSRP
uniref:Glycosyltransferase n=1 Tax=Chlamydomonas leiostraca TaxID=1034604 RepID=A0A7S0RGP0_9CHLO|mmetsp:Transcript_22343/g.56862  ORF Transcript_22343/g.56862 Transcript_22343/m.56862 type:complete len:491 (+) Transcript_22343:21-1493(+)